MQIDLKRQLSDWHICQRCYNAMHKLKYLHATQLFSFTHTHARTHGCAQGLVGLCSCPGIHRRNQLSCSSHNTSASACPHADVMLVRGQARARHMGLIHKTSVQKCSKVQQHCTCLPDSMGLCMLKSKVQTWCLSCHDDKQHW